MTRAQRAGPPVLPIEPPRSPWQRFYAGVHRLRRRYWKTRAQRLPRPVLSIGNLHWGGTGKTPLTLSLASWLSERGLCVAILSRGYGGTSTIPTVVSRGDGPLVDVRTAGDEPYLLAERLRGVAVVVATRRVEAGRLALEVLETPPDLFLLDDGFSHLALERDLDLLLFPSSDLLAGGRLPPSGRLREPLEAASRADALLVTGSQDTAGVARELAEALRPYGFAGPGFESRSSSVLLPAESTRRRVLLVSGVARSEGVTASAEALGLEVLAHLALGDHHSYPEKTLATIRERFHNLGAEAVATTAKDQVKLAGRLDLPTLLIDLEARPEEAFWQWLGPRIDSLLAAARVAGPRVQ